jgi:hypothetical protein
MANGRYTLWDELTAIWIRAVDLASDAAVPWPVRGGAASLCRALAFEIGEDDVLALRAVKATSACVECFPAAHDLLIAAREVSVDESTLLEPVLARHRLSDVEQDADGAPGKEICRYEVSLPIRVEVCGCHRKGGAARGITESALKRSVAVA